MSISRIDTSCANGALPPVLKSEVVIVGGGIAGLMTALRLAPVPVTLVLKSSLWEGSSTLWAQAGFAAAVGSDDAAGRHAADTVAAGAGLCDVDRVRMMTSQAAARIDELVSWGVPFDRSGDGSLVLHREAAHAANRIIGVQGDRTGRAFMETIVPLVRETESIRILEGAAAQSLVMIDERVSGVFVRPVDNTSELPGPTILAAKAVVLATGGVGGLYRVTTNPPEARGDGIAMAAHAGAELADLEFVQFHPTAMDLGISPAPLATESIRGQGAVLVTETGERFMPGVDPQAEMAPRDVVARAVAGQLRRGRKVFLDSRDAIGDRFSEAFPTVNSICRRFGIDPAREAIPVAPAAHYHMGGIATDECGRTTVPGLWSCGESASAGVHGANRLASNSLLEGLVFSAGSADAIAETIASVEAPEVSKLRLMNAPAVEEGLAPLMNRLNALMAESVGVVRSAEGLVAAVKEFAVIEREAEGRSASVTRAALAARLIATAAYLRSESRGGHFREDFPRMDGAQAVRSRLTLAEADGFLAELGADAPPRQMQGRV